MKGFCKSFFVVLLIGFALSLIIGFQFHQARLEGSKEIFTRIARQQYLYITKNIDWHVESLTNVGSYFRASNDVNHNEFQIYTASIMETDKSYEAIGWIQTIGDRNILADVHSRSAYSHAIGYDVAQDPAFQRLIDLARLKNKTVYVLSKPEVLRWKSVVGLAGLQNANHNELLLVVHPVNQYKPGAHTRGFTFSLLNLSEMTGRPAIPMFKPYISVRVTAHESDGTNALLYKTPEKGVDSHMFHYVQDLDLHDLRLNFDYTPTEFFLNQHENFQGHFLFLCMFLLTLSAAFYVEQMHRNMGALEDANRRAGESNRVKNEFLATISHEIRSPMTGVLGMAELLMEGDLNNEQRNYARTILTSAESLLTVINDILDFSRIESRRLELEPMPINLLEMVDDLCALYSIRAREKALELAVRYVPGTEQFVHADPARLRQVLSNLINNAIKFTEKGSIVVTVRENRDIRLSNPDDVEFVFTVEDTGVGIAADSQEKIFDKFVQLDGSARRDVGGMGLGLAICRRLVHLMGGELTVQSELGSGSVFTFNVNLRRNIGENYAPIKPAILKDVKCLIVDDLSIIRTVVSEQLNLSGMRCSSAANGEEALNLIARANATDDPYKILVVDYLMPEMDGEAVARAINDMPGTPETCLIMLTGAGIPVVADDFVRKGFSAHISKPVKGRLLVETLAVIWRRYKDGETKSLIRIDSQFAKRPTSDHITADGARILLAEDSRINQAFAEDTLAQMNCTVVIASNGQEAVKAAVSQSFDLILMDCQMPVMDGFEATRQICDLKRKGIISENLHIVALTANSMKGDREKCFESGMDDYLAKPVRSRELKEKVHYWVMRARGNVPLQKAKTEMPADNVVPFAKIDETDSVLSSSVSHEAKRLLKDRYAAILNAYIEDTENYISEISTAIAQADIAAAIRPAHTIKSSSRHMGAIRLASAAEDLEKHLRGMVEGHGDSDPTQAKQRLNDVRTLFEQSREALQAQKAV